MYMCVYIYIYIYIHCQVVLRRGPLAGTNRWGERWSAKSQAKRRVPKALHKRSIPLAPWTSVESWVELFNIISYYRQGEVGARAYATQRSCSRSSSLQSRFIKGGCSGNRVQWFTLSYRLLYHISLPQSTAPPSHCTPL